MGTRFFLSYARQDWKDDEFLRSFFDLLVTEVRAQAAIDAAEVAYRDDANLDMGEQWKAGLPAALAETACLVCILTPTYFTRPYCGRELEFFRQRIARFNPGAPLILPILWIPPSIATPPYPAVVTDLQYGKNFPPVYGEKGLKAIVRNMGGRYRDQWEDIRDGLVKAIVEHPAKHPLPAWTDHPALETMPDIFAHDPDHPEPAPPSQGGPGKVRFALCAGSAAELSGVNGAYLDRYGNSNADWKPFHPPSSRRIRPLLQAIAAEVNLESDFVDVSPDNPESLTDLVYQAQKSNTLVLVMVDPWTCRIESYHVLLKEFDGQNYVNAGTMVPWKDQTREKAEDAQVLMTALEATFPSKVRDARSFRLAVPEERFQTELREVLMEVQKEVMRRAEVYNKAEGAKVFVKPVISPAARKTVQ